jgi:carbonic anhydrase
MKKLIRGIIDFRLNTRPEAKELYAKLALGQSPDTLFVCCSDSRVAPNVFASTDPGDLFVIRNVGNIVPPCGHLGHSVSDESEAAALEFSVLNLGVRDIIVCGHSECGAMIALHNGRENLKTPYLKAWLSHGEKALGRLDSKLSPQLAPHNRISQLNVLLQLEHLMSYPMIQERVSKGELRLHGWWFDIAKANVHCYEPELGRFVLIDETEGTSIIQKLRDDS